MTEEQKSTAKSVWIVLAPYIGAVILDIALCGLLVISGKELTVEAVVAITGCVGALLFFHKKGGASMISGGALVIAAALLMGCGAACQTERSIVDATELGIAATDAMVGDRGGEDYERVSLIAHGAHQLGSAAVDACELARDGAGWQVWVEFTLESLTWMYRFIIGAGPADIGDPPPIELLRAMAMLEHETSVAEGGGR
jgi:hypothetical protein